MPPGQTTFLASNPGLNLECPMDPIPTHILVVEDEPIVALHLQQRLERMGYRVPDVVATGEAAIETAMQKLPQLVLMDISLEGGMDGVEAAEQITTHLRIPVVFLTAFSNDRTLERAKVTEPYGYLLKLFEERELQTTIEVALYKHQAERALREANEDLERRVEERTAEPGFWSSTTKSPFDVSWGKC